MISPARAVKEMSEKPAPEMPSTTSTSPPSSACGGLGGKVESS